MQLLVNKYVNQRRFASLCFICNVKRYVFKLCCVMDNIYLLYINFFYMNAFISQPNISSKSRGFRLFENWMKQNGFYLDHSIEFHTCTSIWYYENQISLNFISWTNLISKQMHFYFLAIYFFFKSQLQNTSYQLIFYFKKKHILTHLNTFNWIFFSSRFPI